MQVAVWIDENGEIEYDEVYAHGHLDASALSNFVVLTLNSLQNPNMTKTLELTADHFVVVFGGGWPHAPCTFFYLKRLH